MDRLERLSISSGIQRRVRWTLVLCASQWYNSDETEQRAGNRVREDRALRRDQHSSRKDPADDQRIDQRVRMVNDKQHRTASRDAFEPFDVNVSVVPPKRDSGDR